MSSFLTPLQSVRRPLAGAGAFWRWWASEMADALPPAIAPARTARTSLLLDMQRGALRRSGADSGSEIDVSGAMAEGDQALAYEVSRHARRLGVRALAVRLENVVTAEASFPLAARNDLDSLIGLELDRLTPFSKAEAAYVYRVRDVDRKSGRLKAAVTAAPQAALDRARRIARESGLNLIYAGPDPEGVQDDMTGGGPRPETRWAWGAVAALLAVNLAIPLIAAQLAQADLRAEARQTRTAAAEAAAERNELARSRALESRLTDPAQELTPHLARLARLLPADARMTRLVFENGVLEIYGETPETARLAALLAGEPAFRDVSYIAPANLASEGSLETFSLAIALNSAEGDDRS